MSSKNLRLPVTAVYAANDYGLCVQVFKWLMSVSINRQADAPLATKNRYSQVRWNLLSFEHDILSEACRLQLLWVTWYTPTSSCSVHWTPIAVACSAQVLRACSHWVSQWLTVVPRLSLIFRKISGNIPKYKISGKFTTLLPSHTPPL